MAFIKKSLIFLIAAGILIFSACDDFNEPIVPFIDYNTGSARGLGFKIISPNHNRGSFYAILPDEETEIIIDIHNPTGYDLELSLTGAGMDKGAKPPEAVLNGDKKSVTITIFEPDRNDIFNLTLEMSFHGRQMIPFDLPRLEALYLDNDLYNFSAKLKSTDLQPIHEEPSAPYSARIRTDVDELYLSFYVESHASFRINGTLRTGTAWNDNYSVPTNGRITITVIADSGQEKDYVLNLGFYGEGRFDIIFADLTPVTEPPVITASTTINRANDESLVFSLTAAGFSGYKWYFNGSRITASTPGFAISSSQNTLTVYAINFVEGTYEVTLVVNDSSGNGYSAAVSFTVTDNR